MVNINKLAKYFKVEVDENKDEIDQPPFKTINVEAKGCSLHVRQSETDHGFMFDFQGSSRRCKAGNYFEELGFPNAYETGSIFYDTRVCENEEIFDKALEYIKDMMK